jgi:flagellin
MIGINSNINSLVAQQNLNGTQSSLSSAITRLSSGKRINSAADDAAGQAIAARMTTQINGLNQGVSNANDGVSMVQTAGSGLNQITDNLQRIRQLAVQSATGSMSSSDQAALQKEVQQRIAEVNRIASQTTYNGIHVLDGSAGVVTFQIGANVGQTIAVDLSEGVSAAKIGGGFAQKGGTLGSITGLSLDANGSVTHGGATITTINVLSDGRGGFSYTDQNNQSISTDVATKSVFSATKSSESAPSVLALRHGFTSSASDAQKEQLSAVNLNNRPSLVSDINIGTTNGANSAIEAVDNAMTTVNNIQADLGAAQNRFTSISATQQSQSTNLSSAQSQITDANFAQETANLSKAQVLQQAGISVLAQANSLPQQVLKLLS